MHPIMRQIEKERAEFSIGELASEFEITPRASPAAELIRTLNDETAAAIRALASTLKE